jgi:hypothetical protein
MDKSNVRDSKSRNSINDRMQNFFVPQTINPQNMSSTNLDNDYYSYKPNVNNNDKFETIQKTDFKNDINERMNMITDMSTENMRRLPFNNNIRDYQITTDSKRDQFNERMSNYSLLSNNMVAPIDRQVSSNNLNFHSNFKEDHNSRMQELSPLSRNMGLPVTKEVPNQKEVMEKIRTGEERSEYDIQSYSNTMDTYEFLDDVPNIPVNNIKPMDSRQQFNFNQ